MKTVTFLFLIILNIPFNIYSQPISPGQPEFYFFLKDYPGANYMIYAQKVGNSPVYDINYQPTNNFNTQYEMYDEIGQPDDFAVTPNGYTYNRGYDWMEGTGGGRGILGQGEYMIFIQRESSPGSELYLNIFSFYFDVRLTDWGLPGSPDLLFYFDYYDDGEAATKVLTVQHSPNQPRNVPMHSLVELWAELNLPKDWSGIIYNSTLTNDYDGSANYNTPIIFEEAPSGFPFDQYNPGHIFPVQSIAQFWKNTIYTLSVTDQVTNYNNKDYKARHWNTNLNCTL